ncbi:MAG: hypothetical protein LRZ85_10215 [Alphaproteobacteria bacterium]|nr:hypothetical protein [Alphaproteobacteria bacterium]MCD8520580.1 hypothetical protein [Alphaproteobacteria bacterium]MCD8525809.1 hypothetical protein [Alphaproteobacteria bacterium]MCD8571429.1 hypothetical protein [Alphaproteobacteria bacterium]
MHKNSGATSSARHLRSQPAGGKLLGAVVLLLGLAAIGGVGIFGYSLLQPDAIPFMSRDMRENNDLPPPQTEDSLRGSANAHIPQEEDFQGAWEAAFTGGASAIVGFEDGTYQILLAEDPTLPKRLYSVGTYQFDPQGGSVTLIPDFNPQVEAPPGLMYDVLTYREYKLLVKVNPDAGRLFIQPPSVEGSYDQIHPLFFHAGSLDLLTGWSRRTAPSDASTQTQGTP